MLVGMLVSGAAVDAVQDTVRVTTVAGAPVVDGTITDGEYPAGLVTIGTATGDVRVRLVRHGGFVYLGAELPDSTYYWGDDLVISLDPDGSGGARPARGDRQWYMRRMLDSSVVSTVVEDGRWTAPGAGPAVLGHLRSGADWEVASLSTARGWTLELRIRESAFRTGSQPPRIAFRTFNDAPQGWWSAPAPPADVAAQRVEQRPELWLPVVLDGSEPLVIGETFTLRSDVLDETRRINVYRPPYVADSVALPVLYMPDGGIAEDFLHVAGLVQVLSGNGGMKPMLLVGIENTQRRRDMTGPTEQESDRRIAPVVGGSARFRAFIRDELMPEIRNRYRTSDETAIVGESLAGLFIVETFVLEPELFDTYIAFDPSLWWNGNGLMNAVGARERVHERTVFLANSGQPEIADLTRRFAGLLGALSGVEAHYEDMPEETHASIYHPAALKAFRRVFAPQQ